MALIPMVPLALLLITVPQFGLTAKWLPKGLTVLESMLIGSVLGMLVTGDAATIAFNTSVTPHAPQFGMTPIDLGNLAFVGGALGRSMSPVAAGCIIAAGFAGVSRFEIAKRNAIPMLVAAVAVMLILGR